MVKRFPSQDHHRVCYLLLQMRDTHDRMRLQEQTCFRRALNCDTQRITAHDLLTGIPSPVTLSHYDVILFGGSGRYYVSSGGQWWQRIQSLMEQLCDLAKPTFASCWGFQGMARALGGTVCRDLANAELGSLPVKLTTAGQTDPVFGALPGSFLALMGHEDRVVTLPTGATLLASSEQVPNQAFRVDELPIYCTQFHPELARDSFIERLRSYPEYVQRIAGVSLEEFVDQCHNTPDSALILPRFVEHVLS